MAAKTIPGAALRDPAVPKAGWKAHDGICRLLDLSFPCLLNMRLRSTKNIARLVAELRRAPSGMTNEDIASEAADSRRPRGRRKETPST